MNAPGLSLIAQVRFPPISLTKLLFNPKLYSLIRNHMLEAEPDSRLDYDFLERFCQVLVGEIVQYVIEKMSPIMTEWLSKRPQIYSLVQGKQCFFGVDEAHILSNMNNVLPCTLALTRNTAPHAHCGTLKRLNEMFAKEIAAIVNCKVAAEMNSNTNHLGDLNYESNRCVGTCSQIVALTGKTLDCMRRFECKCPQQPEKESTTTPEQEKKTQYQVVRKNHSEVLYCTSKTALMLIMTEEIHNQINEDSNGQPDSPYTEAEAEDEAVPEDSLHLNEDLPHLHPQQQDDTVVFVVTGLLMHSIKKAQATVSQQHFNRTVHMVSEKVLQQIKPSDIAVGTKKDRHIYKVVFSELSQTFDYTTVLLKLQDSDNFIIEALKKHLTMPSRKTTTTTFFSAVTRAIMKPFRAANLEVQTPVLSPRITFHCNDMATADSHQLSDR
ncbi:hypothetical protein JOB18_045459 [Solea senegalensis]|uniref:Uncharacterized protein n=1 Tax=Solea senegalensis TaxID=28829 RepID=A0AAV6RGA0_SOLSE|nr:hypothetical protein JOB18_045459 [Solea senegalensis]